MTTVLHAPPARFDGLSMIVFERGFFRPRRRKPIHGVELLRLKFIRDALALGVRVTLPMERSWRDRLPDYLGEMKPALITVPYLFRRGPTGYAAALLTRRRRADALLLGDPETRQIPAIKLLLRAGVARRVVVSAEGENRERLMRELAPWPLIVVANSEFIAAKWRGKFNGELHIHYGVGDAHHFHPPVSAREKDTVDFVLLAKLPGVSKGEGTAIEAFMRLPEDVRATCRLHLAGYVDPPPPPAPGIVMHRWVANDAVGEFLRGMDVQLVPSTWESFCQSAVQGMLTGLPLITSDIPVLREKLDTGGGIVCRTVDDYAQAMGRLARDASLRRDMGAIARRTALERYVWDSGDFIARFIRGPAR